MKQAGNSENIMAVYLSNRGALERFVRSRFSHGVEAEDAIQELWLRIEGMDDSGIEEPLAYLFKMANNLAIDRKRSAQMQTKREKAWMETRIQRVVNDTVDAEPNAERILLSRERLQAVDQLLASLPERTSRIFRQFRVNGVPQKIIAHEENIGLSAVEKHLMKAYRALLVLKSDGEKAQ
tara:strand:+ start:4101 stop:4640 length:540 start_codon:yes stop_codon:yes gene_type:complete